MMRQLVPRVRSVFGPARVCLDRPCARVRSVFGPARVLSVPVRSGSFGARMVLRFVRCRCVRGSFGFPAAPEHSDTAALGFVRIGGSRHPRRRSSDARLGQRKERAGATERRRSSIDILNRGAHAAYTILGIFASPTLCAGSPPPCGARVRTPGGSYSAGGLGARRFLLPATRRKTRAMLAKGLALAKVRPIVAAATGRSMTCVPDGVGRDGLARLPCRPNCR
jgi:hypothetical protein